MTFFNLRVPFFLPVWRRVLTVAAIGGWTIVELVTASPGWAVLFGAAGLFAAYEFFIIFDPEKYKD